MMTWFVVFMGFALLWSLSCGRYLVASRPAMWFCCQSCMEPKTIRRLSAFTFIEMLVILVLLVLVGSVVLAGSSGPVLDTARALDETRNRARSLSCHNNLKGVYIAYSLWRDDHADHYPAEQSVAKGGWGDFLTNADQGALCWTN